MMSDMVTVRKETRNVGDILLKAVCNSFLLALHALAAELWLTGVVAVFRQEQSFLVSFELLSKTGIISFW